MQLYDISIPLSEATAVWPGDAPFEHRWTMTRKAGASVNVSQIRLSVHSGTHVDAPLHFLDDGAAADQLPLERYFGPACVIDVRGRSKIRTADIENIDLTATPRVLFRSDAWVDHRRFPETIPVMDVEVVELLAKRGVFLVGVDVPSVDDLDSKELPVHHALQARGIGILESLALAQVPAGVYQLIALPLRLCGADGAPVRAILHTGHA